MGNAGPLKLHTITKPGTIPYPPHGSQEFPSGTLSLSEVLTVPSALVTTLSFFLKCAIWPCS
uniref:Early E3 6.4 kDa protein n=1 Tax=Human adenovirus B serotype 35 TaxID=10522 RepID=E306_ADE35|nr:RecName: Full=Early E3 6.4 kDa protein [Human adenovirus 35]AAA42436.1 6.4 kDa ORF [Human adenovirus 35]